jgi:hypothetical protein
MLSPRTDKPYKEVVECAGTVLLMNGTELLIHVIYLSTKPYRPIRLPF